MVGAIRGEAESHSDSEMQKRLLAAARQLADATANMVEAAKVRHAGGLSCDNDCMSTGGNNSYKNDTISLNMLGSSLQKHEILSLYRKVFFCIDLQLIHNGYHFPL